MARTTGPRQGRSSRSTKLSASRAGSPAVIPFLAVQDGIAALEFYKAAFGARELSRETTADGRLLSGRLRIGQSLVMVSDVFPGDDVAAPSAVGTTTVTLQLYTKNVDRAWDRAVVAGAQVVIPLEDQYWGERHGHLIDPFGHHWSLAMRIHLSRAEKAKMEAEARAAFSHGENPHQQPAYLDA